MKSALYVAAGALAVIALVFAYRAGQNNVAADLEATIQEEIDRIRQEHDLSLDGIRDDIVTESKELADSFLLLREELARAGIHLGPLMPDSSSEDAEAEPPSEPISEETFASLKPDMTLTRVTEILGREGVLMFKIEDGDGTLTEIYRWSWPNEDGEQSSISLNFVDAALKDGTYSE